MKGIFVHERKSYTTGQNSPHCCLNNTFTWMEGGRKRGRKGSEGRKGGHTSPTLARIYYEYATCILVISVVYPSDITGTDIPGLWKDWYAYIAVPVPSIHI